MKKIFKMTLCLIAIVFLVAGCTNDSTLEMGPKDIIDNIYKGVSSDKMPMLETVPLTEENLSSFLGVETLDMKEGYASEPAMGSMAWSVVVVEVNDDVDVAATKEDIKAKVDPRKWICVDAEEVIVESRGNKIILIMMDEEFKDVASTVQKNFKNLK